MHESPGTLAVFEIDDLAKISYSTHRLSLALFMKYLQEHTRSDVFLLGVQPGTTELGQKMTVPMQETLQMLVKHFVGLLGEKHPVA
jgi:hydrogenase maturation protease